MNYSYPLDNTSWYLLCGSTDYDYYQADGYAICATLN
jgi:hypothetical protein